MAIKMMKLNNKLEHIVGSTLKKLRAPILATIMATSSLGLFQACEKIEDTSEPEKTVTAEITANNRLKDYGKLFFITESFDFTPGTDYDLRPTLWMSKSDGRGLKLLVNNVALGGLEISPDYKNISYVKGDKHVIMDTAGLVKDEFLGGERSELNFSWTPDSKAILYGIYCDGIYKYNLETKNISKLFNTNGFFYDHEPTMSPITGKIAFIRHSYGSQAHVYTMNSKGDSVKLISKTITTEHDVPLELTWLDKNHVYCFSYDSLYYINVDNKECKAIHLGSTVADAKLSPDKKTIALLCGGYKLKYLNVEEIPSGIVNLHKSQYNIFQGYGWSPDSKYIVIADLGVMRIIDIFDKEYKFLEKKDFPQSATDLAKIVWTF